MNVLTDTLYYGPNSTQVIIGTHETKCCRVGSTSWQIANDDIHMLSIASPIVCVNT